MINIIKEEIEIEEALSSRIKRIFTKNKIRAIMKSHYHEGSANGSLPKRRPSIFYFDVF